MICKCGYQNRAGEAVCWYCGSTTRVLTPEPKRTRETCPLCGGPVLYKGLTSIECLGPDAGGPCENKAKQGSRVLPDVSFEIFYDDRGVAWMRVKR